ncbi:MAG: hypothetical protein ACRENP_16535 [Longimicrobiales bacterium]
MSNAAARLPARPSLEQLRKQARERLASLRATNPSATLADAQFALARAYGFESWPRLVHHVGEVLSSGRLEQFEQLAINILDGYHGDAAALQRLISHYGVSYNQDQLRERVASSVNDARGLPGEPTLADVQLMVARQYGFESWAALAQGLAQPRAETVDARTGLSAGPPFYRIDWNSRTIEPHPPLTSADWDTVFDVMKEHGLTGITSAALTDSAMQRLAQLDFVTRVNAGGAQSLTDDGLRQLERMPQLEELEIGGWHCPLTDRGLEVLRHLTALRRCHMGWAQRITDAGTAHLKNCNDLESVNLMGTHTGDGTTNVLRGKSKLRNLTTGRLLTDTGLSHLHDLPVFKTWHGGQARYGLMSFSGEPNNLLLDGPITDRGLARLVGLDGVFALGFFWHAHAFTGQGLAVLATLPHLGMLGCQGQRCDDAAMTSIATLPNLRMLMAQGTVASDDGFVALSKSPSIETIWGRDCPNLGSRGFAALANMPALQGIGVSCKNVDDVALAALPNFPRLRQLMPMDVHDDGFRHVGRCAQLQDLWCMYCRDTGDRATQHIANLKLTNYYAGKTKITDRSLEILARMITLEKLEFWETAGITDAGIAMLARLPNLREFTISGVPRVTRQGVAAFAPQVRVDYGS